MSEVHELTQEKREARLHELFGLVPNYRGILVGDDKLPQHQALYARGYYYQRDAQEAAFHELQKIPVAVRHITRRAVSTGPQVTSRERGFWYVTVGVPGHPELELIWATHGYLLLQDKAGMP